MERVPDSDQWLEHVCRWWGCLPPLGCKTPTILLTPPPIAQRPQMCVKFSVRLTGNRARTDLSRGKCTWDAASSSPGVGPQGGPFGKGGTYPQREFGWSKKGSFPHAVNSASTEEKAIFRGVQNDGNKPGGLGKHADDIYKLSTRKKLTKNLQRNF